MRSYGVLFLCDTHLGKVKTGAVSTVVIVSIHVKDLLPFNRQQS